MTVDIGPLHNVLHAENYCEIMLAMSNGIVSDCYAVLEYPGYEPLDTFTSTAMLRLSADGIQNVLSDENNVFNLQDTSRKLIQVKEGEMLGNGVDQIVKITPSGVLLVSDEGIITKLPLDYLPESPFQQNEAPQISDEAAEIAAPEIN